MNYSAFTPAKLAAAIGGMMTVWLHLSACQSKGGRASMPAKLSRTLLAIVDDRIELIPSGQPQLRSR
eukprot:scaffold4681_cov72-Cyclotella_meneghiniana.AAC.9